jgi:hypothetical protein
MSFGLPQSAQVTRSFLLVTSRRHFQSDFLVCSLDTRQDDTQWEDFTERKPGTEAFFQSTRRICLVSIASAHDIMSRERGTMM